MILLFHGVLMFYSILSLLLFNGVLMFYSILSLLLFHGVLMFYSILSRLLFHGVLMFYSILSVLLFYVLLHLICILLPLLHWSVCLSLYCVEFEWPKRRKIKPFYAFIMNNNVILYCILIIWENILRNFHLARFIHSVWLICQIHDLL